MITTDEAAKRLSISRSRVLELIKNGQLKAQKLSGVWFVDEASVDERARTVNRKGGRPRKGEGKSDARFTLMNRTNPIAEVVYNVQRREFTSVGEVLDDQRAPIGLGDGARGIGLGRFNEWWRNRGIPRTRNGIDELLRQAGVEVPEALIKRNLGLSLSDQYWIRPNGSGLSWEDANFFTNDFENASERIAGAMRSEGGGRAHPDNTSDGNLVKTWLVRNGVRMLEKSGLNNNQEPYNEVVATALHQRLLSEDEYVPYELAGSGSSARSLCPCFLTDKEEYVPALYVSRLLDQTARDNDFDHYLKCCDQLGAKKARASLERMIVCDDILANHDRHFRNFGIVRNVETLECRPAPVFDSGSSLWCDADIAALRRGEFSFTSKQFEANPGRQLLLVEDFSWLDATRMEGFVDEAIEILSANDLLEKRLPYIREGLERRIARILDIAAWA